MFLNKVNPEITPESMNGRKIRIALAPDKMGREQENDYDWLTKKGTSKRSS